MNLRRQCTILFLLLISSTLVSADIYRCDDGDTTVFSDLPCAENAERYAVVNRISVIEVASDLDAIAERTRQIVAERQQRRENARTARRLQEQERERLSARRQPVQTVPVFFPRQIIDNPINRPSRPDPDPDDGPVRANSRSAILSNQPSSSQREILSARRDTP